MSYTTQLETALLDRDIIHFLLREGFLTLEVHDSVLDPRSMLSGHQKAGELVGSISNQAELSAKKYHTLMNHLRRNGKQLDILDKDYSRQEQAGTVRIYVLKTVL